MGFERKKKQFKLKFPDPDMEGLVVLASSPSMDTFVAISNMAGQQATTAELNQMLEMFCDSLVEWNLEEKGVPVPATIEGLRTQDPEFCLDIIDAWMDAVQGVPDAPLGTPSQDGEQFPEASIPMNNLPEGLAS